MSAVVHDFMGQLEWSQRMSDEGAWVAFYRRIWPELLAIVRADANSQWQAWGVDRWIVLPNGRQLLIDEKKRSEKAVDRDGQPYTDVLLEEISVFYGVGHPRNKIGWSLDGNKRIDFVAYAIPLAARCYLLPFELLRLAYIQHRAEWHRNDGRGGRPRWYPFEARNQGYATINCAVPWATLRAALTEQMHRKFGDGCPLPSPEMLSGQEHFVWSDHDGDPPDPGDAHHDSLREEGL